MKTLTRLLALVLTCSPWLVGCNVDISQAQLQSALTGELRDTEALSQLCGRPIAQMEANSSGTRLTFSDVKASRGFFGKEGKATAKVDYRSNSGPACGGTLAFDFLQEASMKQYARRNVSYSSEFALSHFVITPR